MGEQNEGIFASEKKVLTWNFFVNLELDLELLVQGDQREEGILTENDFFRREEGREIGFRRISSQRVDGRIGIGLRLICASKSWKRRGEQVRRGVRSKKN